MTIEDIVRKYNGTMHDAYEWWPDGALDYRERIVELPLSADHDSFMAEMNRHLYENPIQYISYSETARFFLYYAE